MVVAPTASGSVRSVPAAASISTVAFASDGVAVTVVDDISAGASTA